MILKIIICLIIFCLIQINGQNLQISVVDNDPNVPVIVQGFFSQYISIKPVSRIKITCNKNGFSEGTIFATVNTIGLYQPTCLNYAPLNNGQIILNDIYCLKKEFVYDLSLQSQETSFYQIECRISENSALNSNKLVFLRLYNDYLPRIRENLFTFLPSVIPNFNIDQTTLSCEATTDSSSRFNGVQFYQQGIRTTNFNLQSNSIQITPSITNYSVTFQLTPNNFQLYKSTGGYYECCTTLNNIATGNCAPVFLYGNGFIINPPFVSSTFSTSTTTTRPATTPTTTTTTSRPGTATTPKVTINTTTLNPNFTTTVTYYEEYYTGLTSQQIGIIVGVICGVFVLLVFVILGLLCYKKRYYDPRKRETLIVTGNSKNYSSNNEVIFRTKKNKKNDLTNLEIDSAYDGFKNRSTIRKTHEVSIIDAYDNNKIKHPLRNSSSAGLSSTKEIQNNRKTLIPHLHLPDGTHIQAEQLDANEQIYSKASFKPPPPPNQQMNDLRESNYTSVVNVIQDDGTVLSVKKTDVIY